MIDSGYWTYCLMILMASSLLFLIAPVDINICLAVMNIASFFPSALPSAFPSALPSSLLLAAMSSLFNVSLTPFLTFVNDTLVFLSISSAHYNMYINYISMLLPSESGLRTRKPILKLVCILTILY